MNKFKLMRAIYSVDMIAKEYAVIRSGFAEDDKSNNKV